MPETTASYSVPLLTRAEFDRIRALAYRTFGLDLREGKERLVSARLNRHIRSGGYTSFDQYLGTVLADRTGQQLLTLIDSLTTNHTSFLREIEHFKFLSDVVFPGYTASKKMAIWSAASSTGEEPYSILFTALNSRTRPSSGVRVVASDISQRVLTIARNGIYNDERLKDLPPEWIAEYFIKSQTGDKASHQVRLPFRQMIDFRRVNLMDSHPAVEKFHVIFCRNVMIYFDRKTQADLVGKLAGLLEPRGYLFVGHAESLSGIDHPLRYVRPAIYMRADDR